MLTVLSNDKAYTVVFKGIIGDLTPSGSNNRSDDIFLDQENKYKNQLKKTKLVNEIFVNYITAVEFADVFNKLDPKKLVELVIISPGGSVYEAELMIDTITDFRENKKGIVNIVAPSYIGSCATWLALSGDKLTITPDTRFVIHSVYCEGSDFKKLDFATLDSLTKLIGESNNKLAELYATNSDKPKEFYLGYLNKNEDIELDYKLLQQYGFKNLEVVNNYEVKNNILNLNTINYQPDDIKTFRECEMNLNNFRILNNCKLQNKASSDGIPESGNSSNPPAETDTKTPPVLNNSNDNVEQLRELQEQFKNLSNQLKGLKGQLEENEKQLEKDQEKIKDLFKDHEDKPAFSTLRDELLKNKVNFEMARLSFNQLLAKEQKDTIPPMNQPANNTLNFDKDTFKRALLLKNHLMPLSEEEAEKTNTLVKALPVNAFLNKNDKTLLGMSCYDLLKNNILTKLNIDGSELKFFNKLKEQSWIIKNLTTSDLEPIITELTPVYWAQGESYKSLLKVLSICKFHQADTLNAIKVIEDETGIPKANKLSEGGEITYYSIKLGTKTFALERYGLGIRATYESLINDTMGVINNGFNKLILGFQRSLRDCIIETVVRAKNKMRKVTKVTTLNIDALDKVYATYSAMKDSTGAALNIKPTYVLASGPAAMALRRLLNNPTDPFQNNPGVINPYYIGTNENPLTIIDDDELNNILEKLAKIVGSGNKNDIFFIPKDCILYLAPEINNMPNVETINHAGTRDMEIVGDIFYGCGIQNPEKIVVLEGKDLTNLASPSN